MYLSFFDLRDPPFSTTPDPAFLFWSTPHREVYETLRGEILDGTSTTLLTGDIGTGKSTLINALLADSAIEGGFHIVLMRNRLETEADVLRWFLSARDIEETDPDRLWRLVDQGFATRAVQAGGMPCLVVVDEAQTLSRGGARALTRLVDTQADLRLVLAGQNELDAMLEQPEYRGLAARLDLALHLGPLPAGTTGNYVRTRLERAGATRQIFDAGAVEVIAAATRNTPRLINKLCDVLLFLAATEDRDTVDAVFVRRMLGENVDSDTLGLTMADMEAVSGIAAAAGPDGETDVWSGAEIIAPASGPAAGRSGATGIRGTRPAVSSPPLARRIADHDIEEAEILSPGATAEPGAEPDPHVEIRPRHGAWTAIHQSDPGTARDPEAWPPPPYAAPNVVWDLAPDLAGAAASYNVRGSASEIASDYGHAAPFGPATFTKAGGGPAPPRLWPGMAGAACAGALAVVLLLPAARDDVVARTQSLIGTAPAALSQQDETAAPPRQDDTAAPPRQDNTAAPPRQDDTAAPPRQDNTAAPPRQDNTAAPPRQDNTAAPPRQDNTTAPPRQDSTTAPPRQDSTTAPSVAAPTALPRLAGAPPDPAAAETYFLQALDQVDATATAIAYARAAVRGHRQASLYLGQMFETGDGVPFAPEIATRWYDVADGTLALHAALPAAAPPVGTPVAAPMFSERRDDMLDLVWNGTARSFRIELADAGGTPLARFDTPLTAAAFDIPATAALWRISADDTLPTDWTRINSAG